MMAPRASVDTGDAAAGGGARAKPRSVLGLPGCERPKK